MSRIGLDGSNRLSSLAEMYTRGNLDVERRDINLWLNLVSHLLITTDFITSGAASIKSVVINEGETITIKERSPLFLGDTSLRLRTLIQQTILWYKEGSLRRRLW